jgi:hypothetical protein
LAATALVELEGIAPDSSGRMLTDALIAAEKIDQPNVLGFLRSMPGEQASIDLSKIADTANRLKTNLEKRVALVLATVFPADHDRSLQVPSPSTQGLRSKRSNVSVVLDGLTHYQFLSTR